MMSNQNVMGPLPSLRSTLQKYGLQNLLNDNSVMPVPILCTPTSRQTERQFHLEATPQVYRVEAVKQSPLAAKGKRILTKRIRTRCKVHDCSREARKRQLCSTHGGRSFCKFLGCTSCAHKGGLCISHGGGRRCQKPNCNMLVQYGDTCNSHGGGRRCSDTACNKYSKVKGLCREHFNTSKK